MPDEIRYSTRPEGATLSRASADTRERTLVVLPISSVAAPESLQRASVVCGAPIAVVRAAAERGVPLIARRHASVGAARHHVDQIKRSHNLDAQVLDDDTSSSSTLGAWVAAAAGAVGLLLSGGLMLLAIPGASIAGLASLVILGGGVYAARSAGRQRTHTVADAADADASLRAQGRLDGTALAAILRVREASLADEVPVEAQVELWRDLEEIERALSVGELTQDAVTTALAEVDGRLRGGQDVQRAGNALDALQRTAQAAARARREVDGGR
jgi:hypothetical protein